MTPVDTRECPEVTEARARSLATINRQYAKRIKDKRGICILLFTSDVGRLLDRVADLEAENGLLVAALMDDSLRPTSEEIAAERIWLAHGRQP